MSNHNATSPNIDGQTKEHIASVLKKLLKDRDFVLVVDEYPATWACTNAETPAEAKSIITRAQNKPWS